MIDGGINRIDLFKKPDVHTQVITKRTVEGFLIGTAGRVPIEAMHRKFRCENDSRLQVRLADVLQKLVSKGKVERFEGTVYQHSLHVEKQAAAKLPKKRPRRKPTAKQEQGSGSGQG